MGAELVERAPLGNPLGRKRLFFNLEQAVEAYQCSLPKEGNGNS
jgi:hypothetical protein